MADPSLPYTSDRPDELALRDLALSYPEASEEHPWGERAFKVRGKVFVFMSYFEGVLRVTTKLPGSHTLAAMQPFAEPAGYGLGRAGWVTASFPDGTSAPIDVLRDWIDESYRAVASKRLVATLDGHPSSRER
jgi:predicted DNA-binding protein (MmcQ/YjbR family)